jgi:hypothetical protein
MLEKIQSQLEEGNLDLASITQGLEEIAQDLEGTEETQPAGQAMRDKLLKEAAEEMRKLAESMEGNDGKSMEDVQQTLEQASENQRPGLEELATQLKEAAESLKQQYREGAQQALEQAAQELDNLQEKMQSQDLKNMASQQIQNLQNSLRQRQQSQQRQEQKSQAQKGESQSGPPSGEAPQGEQQAGEPQDQAGGGEGEASDKEGGQEGAPGMAQESGGDGGGLMPSGKGGSEGPREGAPTKLDVKLALEKLEGMQDQGTTQEEIEEESKQERSRLDYRNVKSELSPAQKDLLNQERIPWEYRPLIKDYFQAIRPPAK